MLKHWTIAISVSYIMSLQLSLGFVSTTLPFPLKFQNNIILHRKRTSLNGIPKLFGWLVSKYPDVKQSLVDGLLDPRAKPVDNFYLDMY